MNEIRDDLQELASAVHQLETLELACVGAVSEDRHITYFAPSFQRTVESIRRDLLATIDRIGDKITRVNG